MNRHITKALVVTFALPRAPARFLKLPSLTDADAERQFVGALRFQRMKSYCDQTSTAEPRCGERRVRQQNAAHGKTSRVRGAAFFNPALRKRELVRKGECGMRWLSFGCCLH
ncbi:hypothetical protein TNIN_175761 [Trichonephila inaurata madagascariensis]|uniref:Uncharacterized protein n=1 Tax=Trichonephila inaurata madagascariensis TaxID=2747483 RepID=A0A8X7BZY3_9ARAC|nr:hypothetical protein TNIN_175761 [Trichonephila inaurata madagascariensis]